MLPLVALAGMGVVSATFLAGLAGATAGSVPAYLGLVLAVTVALVGLALLVERRMAGGAGSLVALATVIVVIAGGLLVGAPLQVNTIFGYSVAVAGQIHRARQPRLRAARLGHDHPRLAPGRSVRRQRSQGRASPCSWPSSSSRASRSSGADVGGVLSMVPAFGVTALILTRPAASGGGSVAALGALAAGTVMAVRPPRPGPAARGQNPSGPPGRARALGTVGVVLRQPGPPRSGQLRRCRGRGLRRRRARGGGGRRLPGPDRRPPGRCRHPATRRFHRPGRRRRRRAGPAGRARAGHQRLQSSPSRPPCCSSWCRWPSIAAVPHGVRR